MKQGSKYYQLYVYLRDCDQDELTLDIDEIEKIVGIKLPETARKSRSWWSNRKTPVVRSANWMEAGYLVTKIDLNQGKITFRKPTAVHDIQREGDVVLWDGNLIKSLRHHMKFSQSQLAEEMGVRQQTISEWETQAYRPTRAMSKYLMLIAERAGYTYGEEE